MRKQIKLSVLSVLTLIFCATLSVVIANHLESDERGIKSSSVIDPLDFEPRGEDEEFVDFYARISNFWIPEQTTARSLFVPIIISDYDPIIREVSETYGHDWRLVSAIACAESRFNENAVSGCGAVGLMQIMPVVARQFEVDPGEVTDPYVNVTLGVSLLDYLEGCFRFPEGISERDRMSIVLASYNCGQGHVLDARRLAVKYGENPNSWSVVSKYLKLKGDPVYYGDEVVRCGRFVDNSQTLGFVKKVLNYYDNYCQLAML